MDLNISLPHYKYILFLKTLGKRIQQVSYSTNQIDKHYPLDSLTKEEHKDLIAFYEEQFGELQKIVEEYKKGHK